jgi:uncharacterized protein involved in exopolysaccharide biosynthesis
VLGRQDVASRGIRIDFLAAVRVLRGHTRMFVWLGLAALIASTGIVSLLENQYLATVLVVVKPHEPLRLEQNRAGKETMGYPVSQVAPVDTPSRTYIEMIKSRLLAERVVRMLGLETTKPPASAPSSIKAVLEPVKEWIGNVAGGAWESLQYGEVLKQDPLTKAVRVVQRSCALRTTKDTYLFEITCGATDPDRAAAIANASAEIFIEYTTSVNRQESGSSRTFLEEQLRTSEAVLAQARRALTEFKNTQATFSLQEEYASQLKTISGLETDLEKTEARLAGLQHEYTDNYLRKGDPAVYAKVQSLLAEKNRLQQSLARLRSERAALPDKEKRLEDLRLQLKAAEENYTVVTKALAEVRIQEQSQVTDIRVVSPAVPPGYPSKPLRVYYVAVGVVAALLIGAALVFVRESVWTTVKSTADVERVGLRVLATIPSVTAAGGGLSGRRRRVASSPAAPAR